MDKGRKFGQKIKYTPAQTGHYRSQWLRYMKATRLVDQDGGVERVDDDTYHVASGRSPYGFWTVTRVPVPDPNPGGGGGSDPGNNGGGGGNPSGDRCPAVGAGVAYLWAFSSVFVDWNYTDQAGIPGGLVGGTSAGSSWREGWLIQVSAYDWMPDEENYRVYVWEAVGGIAFEPGHATNPPKPPGEEPWALIQVNGKTPPASVAWCQL
jgi:hypothetical protein